MQRIAAVVLLLLVAAAGPKGIVEGSKVPCTSDKECEGILRQGSQCMSSSGYCSNPFHHGGCLKSMLPANHTYFKTRTCNSNDLMPQAEELGYCRSSPMDYTEIRLASNGWETIMFGAYILQIILSELLDVPTSIEGMSPTNNLNLYDIHSGFDIITAYHIRNNEFIVADNVKDCRLVTATTQTPKNNSRSSDDEEADAEYQPCAHVNQELWEDVGLMDTIAIKNHVELPLRDLGLLGEGALYVTRNAAAADPTLTSYLGLMGEENRQKLAQTFPRPITWGDYCRYVSINNCASTPTTGTNNTTTEAAKRPPATLEEEMSYFDSVGNGEAFRGYFQFTDENNCTKNPTNCTGHYASTPCDWYNWAPSQFFHLNIALKSNGPQAHGGYPYEQLVQVVLAANATNTPLLLNWFSNDVLYSVFTGHPTMEFTRINFEPPTQQCANHRIDNSFQCLANATQEQLVGDALGVCDSFPRPIHVGISKALKEITQSQDLPEEFWSPAYHVIQQYKLNNLQLGQINEYWYNRNTDRYNFDPRDAACRWVVENLEEIVDTYVPKNYPRIVQNTHSDDISQKIAFGIAVGVLCLVAITAIWTFLKRNTRVLYYAQTEFLYLVLLGSSLLCIAAILLGLPQFSDTVCQGIPWFYNFGNLLQVLPLVVRVGAIHRLATSNQQMTRVRVTRKTIYRPLFIIGILVFVFVLIWNLRDPPLKAFDYTLTPTKTSDGEYVVEAYAYCGSDEFKYWYLISAGWKVAILLPGCMMAWLATQVKEDMNDTRRMKWILMTWLFFVGVIIVAYLLLHETQPIDLMRGSSLILSIETMATLLIYFLPKLLKGNEQREEEQLPDVFVNTTVALMHVTGFSAWSSVREPIAVFQMLEKLYASIDTLADQYSVYKVETVGATYVAATGIPKSQGKAEHAVIMARFARACMKKMPKLVQGMECLFGPDTGDLGLKIGMHSGVVTGGFMKGKGARFQLFGDSVNTAMLIEQTSKPSHIHISSSTATLLRLAGKGKWVADREDTVTTREKGELQTFWLIKPGHGLDADQSMQSSVGCISEDTDEDDELSKLESQERWIEWNVSVFSTLLKQIVAHREFVGMNIENVLGQAPLNVLGQSPLNALVQTCAPPVSGAPPDEGVEKASMPLLEVKEIIELPKFDWRTARRAVDLETDVELSEEVLNQLKAYISGIADMYNPNPFHNFAHASYVVMAINKYLNRIIAATELDLGETNKDDQLRTSFLAKKHDHTYGITSDPLTHFSCVFSALIHDVDHPGVPNNQLAKENPSVAQRYQDRSLAEQKSFDLAWSLLMEPGFDQLRSTICENAEDLCRFRQLVVNSVMATDLGDKQLKELRNGRWDKAFLRDDVSAISDTSSAKSLQATEKRGSMYQSVIDAGAIGAGLGLLESSEVTNAKLRAQQEKINRKATIVIEHLIQAADVAHMSQHWLIYRRWNERLFRELYKAYREGRAENNPADGWYKGEIGFFDFYIIPLCEKIRDCGVFGPTSDENLNYATNNRNMWVKEGEGIVTEMLSKVEKEYDAAAAAAAAATSNNENVVVTPENVEEPVVEVMVEEHDESTSYHTSTALPPA